MPEIQAIEDFKTDVISLGNEAAIREKRGESLPLIEKPRKKTKGFEESDFSDLFDDEVSFVEGDSVNDEIEDDIFNSPKDLLGGLDDLLDDSSPIEENPIDSQNSDLNFDDIPEDDFQLNESDDGDLNFDDIPEDDDFNIDDIPEDDDFQIDDSDDGDLNIDDIPEDDDFTINDSDDEDLNIDDIPEDDDFTIDDSDDDFTIDDSDDGDLNFDDIPEDDDFQIDDSDDGDLNIDDIPEDDDFTIDDSDDGDLNIDDIPEDDDFQIDDSDDDDLNFDDIPEGEEFSLKDVDLQEIDDSETKDEDNFRSVPISEEDDEFKLNNIILEKTDSPDGSPDKNNEEAKNSLKNSEFDSLKKCLAELPINLRLVIEELIGEKELSGEELDKLLKALIAGKNAKDIAALTSKIIGTKIKIPAQYERRSAEELEREKNSFSYIFRKNFIPMFRIAAIVAVLLGIFLYLGYSFVYRPIHAETLYRRGYKEITLGNNIDANKYFVKAFNEWNRKKWFFSYAEEFTDYKQYVLAEEKYKQLLNFYPDDRQGILDYAALEFKTLGKYPQAEKLLKDYLFSKMDDYDIRLLLGDVYLKWADELDASKYEEARFNYAKLLSQYGGRDELLFRMLRYFIRTDNYDEAMRLYYGFRENKKTKIEPEVYAELAGYLIDHPKLDNVSEILMQARSIKEDIPEIHYELGRYFNIIKTPEEEKKALLAAISLFESKERISKKQKGMLIDSYNRYGMCLYEENIFIDSEKYFQKAATIYNDALAANQVKPESKYGLIFSNLGDIQYYVSGNYDQALDYYITAETNKYTTQELKYKKGYIYYTKEDYKNALNEFYNSADGYSSERALLYSTANTLFNRNDYYLAEGYFKELLDDLEKENSSTKYLLLDSVPEHRSLVSNLVKVYNNLAVSNYRLYERTKNPDKTTEAMVLLTESIELYDTLVRDPDTLEKPETVNLAYLNSKSIFYPMPGYRLQIYQNIPKDIKNLNF